MNERTPARTVRIAAPRAMPPWLPTSGLSFRERWRSRDTLKPRAMPRTSSGRSRLPDASSDVSDSGPSRRSLSTSSCSLSASSSVDASPTSAPSGPKKGARNQAASSAQGAPQKATSGSHVLHAKRHDSKAFVPSSPSAAQPAETASARVEAFRDAAARD